jgi:hypothetical protein
MLMSCFVFIVIHVWGVLSASSSCLSSCVCVWGGVFCLIRVALLSASVGGGVLAWDSLNRRVPGDKNVFRLFAVLRPFTKRAQSMLIESDGDQMLWMFLPSGPHLMLIAVWGSAWTFGYTWPVLQAVLS